VAAQARSAGVAKKFVRQWVIWQDSSMNSSAIAVPLVIPPVDTFTARAICSLRRRERASILEFAYELNVSPDLLIQWERGLKQPKGPALRLLSIVKSKGLRAIMIAPNRSRRR
jgi:DNA-binding transcriptional regulator YiaG